MKFLLLLFTFILFPVSTILAADRPVESAGVADRVKDFETETPFPYTDIYERRFSYKDSRDELRANIDERRRHYNSGRTPTIESYKNNLDSLHNQQ